MLGGGGGQIEPCDAKLSEKCLCFHHNNIALIKQISLFDIALDKYDKNKKKWIGQNRNIAQITQSSPKYN